MSDELTDRLDRIDRVLSSLLAITVDQYLRTTPDLAKPRPRTIDRMLADAGLRHQEIAAVLGKTRQAVSQILASDGKAKPTNRRGTVTSAGNVEPHNTTASATQNETQDGAA
ncbi:hypothetical protein ACQHIV_13055 [Kribbella sp. GL6]|uniref:hypothetical protein n=1 Tax=Kribbella sp. GL6 TaxID=3419765 RepID=UPI003D01A34F